jgi:hypothetical protein
MDAPFINHATGIAPNLIPNPPGEIPEAPGAGDATARLSPFQEAQDVDAIIKALVLDRPLKLYIPNRDKYPDWDFRIINSIPREMAEAQNKGWKPIDAPELVELFTGLVAGTDEFGKAFRPVLMARPKAVTKVIQKRNRQQLASLYAGMDPSRTELKGGGKYAKLAPEHAGTAASFEGGFWQIRV